MPSSRFFQHDGVVVLFVAEGVKQREAFASAGQQIEFLQLGRRCRSGEFLQVTLAERGPSLAVGVRPAA